MADVFLSYASEDRERIAPLVERLEDQGFSVWWDRRIGVGSSFDLEIERELDAASCVVVVWSTRSVQSEWVRNEASEGQERSILVPVQIDDVRLPLAARRVQTANLVGWPTVRDQEAMTSFMASVSAYVGSSRHGQAKQAGIEQSPGKDPIVVAVLPFVDRSSEGHLKYLCEGIAEDLMDDLFRVDSLHVLSATDTFRYDQDAKTTRDIGQDLGASIVLEGSVRETDGQFAINARVIRVDSGTTIWSDRFTTDEASVLQIHSELAKKAINGLREIMGVRGAVDSAPTDVRDPGAYKIYRRAMRFSSNADAYKRLAHLELAIAHDPSLAEAYVPLIHVYATMVGYPEERTAKTSELLRRLERVDPNGYAVADARAEIEGDMVALAVKSAEAIQSGRRIHAYPHPRGWHDARSHLAYALSHAGLPHESLAFYELVDRENEPNQAWNWGHQAGCHQMLGEFDAAIESFQAQRQVYGEAIGNDFEAICRIAIGDVDGAEAVMIAGSHIEQFLIGPVIRHRRGSDIELPYATHPAAREMVGFLAFAVGQIDRGFEHVEAALELPRHWMAYRFLLIRHLFDERVREHPSYCPVLEQLGLDQATRTAFGDTVKALTPITGIEFQEPLMPI